MGNLSQKYDFASYAFFAVILLYTKKVFAVRG
jgi:hypothetical protein